jgi:hypothetical protein
MPKHPLYNGLLAMIEMGSGGVVAMDRCCPRIQQAFDFVREILSKGARILKKAVFICNFDPGKVTFEGKTHPRASQAV